MDEDVSVRLAALEALVRELAARLEDRPAAGSSLENRLSQLEIRNALLEQRLMDAESKADEAENAEGGAVFKVGGPPEPFAPGAHDEVEPDANVLKGGTGGHPQGNARKDKSVQWAPGVASVLQLNDFDKSSEREFEIGAEDSGSGSGSGSGGDPIQFAGRVPEGGDISKGGTLAWFTLKHAPPRLDTDETGTRASPGMSIDTVTVQQAGGKTTKDLELYQFATPGATHVVLPADSTDSGDKPSDVHILMRLAKAGQRRRLVYVLASSGPFWVKGAGADQNYGEAIKLGTGQNYITITAVP